MANRYAIEREDGFTVVHFGLVGGKDQLIDRMACVFPPFTLETQKENLVQFSDKIRTATQKKVPLWDLSKHPTLQDMKGVSVLGWLPVVDFVHVTNWNDVHAEICFWNYSQGYIGQLGQPEIEDLTLVPFGVAMIRCDIDLQKAFLVDLYDV